MPAAGPHPRISLTLARLLHSRTLLLVITGDDKRAVLERSLDGSAPHFAAARFLARYPGPVDIFWSPA